MTLINNELSIEEKRAIVIAEDERLLAECNKKFRDLATELFFLQHGGNYSDFGQFKKRPSQLLIDHLAQNPIVQNEADKAKNNQEMAKVNKEPTAKKKEIIVPQESPPKPTLPPPQTDPAPKLPIVKTIKTPNSSTVVQRFKRTPRHQLSDVYGDAVNSQEEILERAKQEAVVQRRVADLRRQGLWSQRRLPKVQEPPRNKAHWDYLLEEMRWLAADFAQERKWKRIAARKLVKMVSSYHREQDEKVRKAEKDEQLKLRRIASKIARQVKTFWSNIEKVVEYKQRSLLDEKRMKALDLHLSYIVDQTAKYSDWLTQGLTQPEGSTSPTVSKASGSNHASDDDFLPQGVSSDDEETIAVEEEHTDDNEHGEIEMLKKESELPFEELLSQLPSDLVENIGKPLEGDGEESEDKVDGTEESVEKEEKIEEIELKEEVKLKEETPLSPIEDDFLSDEDSKPSPISLRRSARKRQGSESQEVEPKKLKTEEDQPSTSSAAKEEDSSREENKDFISDAEGSTDDEETLKEEEGLDGEVDHQEEIEGLQAEGEMPIEELLKHYGSAFDGESPPVTPTNHSAAESSGSEAEQDNEEEEIGMDYLMKLSSKEESGREGSPNKEITDVAAEAQSLQPTGHTLATTQVVTPIPPLLKHTLREYQHIGLDWLVTMFNKRLNGILADEMGLGKTIQTIALLAHLACDKGVWGPHLIVVPTSVMLNWEMEFKKWCPGFKILTYYGSQKERKLKRTGWTKSNAFHVCITSYKLVLQDHSSFRRKRWRYLILDEAQNIKNFKSQRWQTLLNFNSQRRLLLTGTPLQNNLMELWSLMHFLMPHVFQSHKEFKEWFSNPMTGMIDGTQEFNEKIIRRLHKVLRPFLLRRIKKDVEKQMPNKYEHVVKCHLSKRQRFLYEDFMSRASTKETLAGGHFMSVINVLMQLRKVCNHPNLFEPRPTVSPFVTPPLVIRTPMLCDRVLQKDMFEDYDFTNSNFCLQRLSNISTLEFKSLAVLKTTKKLIEEISASTKPIESPTKYQISAKVEATVRERLFKTFQNQKLLNPTLSLSKPFPSVQLQQKNQINRNQTTVKTESDTNTNRPTPTSQSITLQYQTAQGTRWATIPNGQIRHLPGGVVQIVTSRTATPVPILSQQSNSQSVDTNSSTDSSKDAKKSGKRLSSESYSKIVANKKKYRHDDVLSRLSRINEQRCNNGGHYLPHNTIALLRSITQKRYQPPLESGFVQPRSRLGWRKGFPTCATTESRKEQRHRVENDAFNELVKYPQTRLSEMKELLERFVCVVPKVVTTQTYHQVSHPLPWKHYRLSANLTTVQSWLSRKMVPLHRVLRNQKVQFPEVRLIEYDCGKLQILNILLRRFWAEKHRILIFTQMTRVLDILEAFLSYHGYRYLRLDGSTSIEQRMIRMERFNNDTKIFCFILSTRSGGIGVNLTGADTVVFYDSDWNPTMDAQAQDRCHRIGQTRDVHIYRLISDRTVEENILKKANQKRLLGDLAIEGGSFTTAFFKQQALKDLFDDPSGLEDLAEQSNSGQPKLTARQKAIEEAKTKEDLPSDPEAAQEEQKGSEVGEGRLEEALLETEDQEDAVAAKRLKIEQDAVMDEFTEAEEKENNEKEDEPPSKFKVPKGSRVGEELRTIYEELSPVERFALNFLEVSREESNDFELQLAEDAVERSKKDWELAHLVALKHEEERRMEEEDEIFYTREDSTAEIYVDENTGEIMPIWFPPTPPQDDLDLYVDPTHVLLYRPHIMTEAQLPHLVGKKKKQSSKLDVAGSQSHSRKLARLDVNVPKSLFNRGRKKDSTKLKVPVKTKKGINTTPTKNLSGQALPTAPASSLDIMEPLKSGLEAVSGPDWVINEEWALLQAVQQILEMPLTLLTKMPAHTPNWHLVADMVNGVSSVYRSPKQCKLRYEDYIRPREDGRTTLTLQEATTPKKKLKALKAPKAKLSKTQKTNVLYAGDSNHMFTALYSNRFDACKLICNKRNPPKISGGSGQFQRNPKHTNILHDCGIIYDKPLHPVQVAAARAKRIQNQKKSSSEQTSSSLPSGGQSSGGPIPPSGHSIAISQVGNTLVVANGNQIVGKGALPGGSQSIGQLTAIPISGASSNIVVNSAFPRRVNQTQVGGAISVNQSQVGGAISVNQSQVGGAISVNQQQVSGAISIQGATAKLQAGKGGSSLTLRAIAGSGNTAQQPPLVTITTATAGTSATRTRPTITYPAQGAAQIQKLTTMQQIKQGKQQNIQSSTLKQQVKQLRVGQQGGQHLTGTIVTGNPPNTILAGGKKVQLAKMTAQEFELLMKQRPVKTVPHRQQQVQIAPVRAQVQAHQVQMIAAQQATQANISSKPLPITVPVSNIVPAVNLTGLTVPSSAHNKQMIVTGGQGTGFNQLILQQHLMKHQQQQTLQTQQQQQLQQQQQSRQVFVSKQQKQVYSHVVPHQLISSQGKTQMYNRIIQQQSKRRIATTKNSSQSQLTVTKFLPTQSGATSGQPLRHTILPQNSQLAQQIALPGATSIVTASNLTNQQPVQRVVSQGQLQLPRVRQIHPGIQTVVGPTVVASAPITMQRSLPTTPATNQNQAQPQIRTNAPQTTSQSQPSLPTPQILTMATTPDAQQQQEGQFP